MPSQTNPRSPDYDPQAARLAAEERGARSGAYAERRKQAAKRKETVSTEKAKSERRGRGSGRAQARREHREQLADPTGPVARQARRSYSAGQADVVDFFKELQRSADITETENRRQRIAAEWTPPPPPGSSGLSDFFDRNVQVGAPQRAPTFGTTQAISMSMSRTTGTRLIIIMSAATALAIVVKGQSGQSGFQTNNGHTILVSTKLRSYAALIIVTTIALIINEMSPAVAVGFQLVLMLDVLVNTGVMSRLGDVLGHTPVQIPGPPNDPTQVPGAATSQESLAWIQAHLGQWPHPGKGASDFWNAIAASEAQKAGVPMQGKP